jgi:hypothetical protein
MSHFAKIENGIVTNVIVAEQDFIDTLDGTWIQTSYRTRGGVHYDTDVWPPSADGGIALRKNYAGIGYTYNAERDGFIPPDPNLSLTVSGSAQLIKPMRYTFNEESCLWELPLPTRPYLSWSFNTFTLSWEAPIPKPTDGNTYTWFESLSSWVKYTRPQTINDIKEMSAQELSGLYLNIGTLSALNVPTSTVAVISAAYACTPTLSALTIYREYQR